MATKNAYVKVSILGDARGATSAMSEAERGAQAFEQTMDRAAVGAGIALAGIGAGAYAAVDAASDLQQAQGAVSAIFGENADAISTLGEDAAQRLGLAQTEYGNLTSLLGSQLQNMGIAADELVPKTDELVTLGADLAATYGGSTADAVSAVSSLLKGERDPIERYGVSIKQADIEAQKLAMGLDGLEGEAAKQADTTATLALLYEQTSSAAGMFASEADTLAGAQARADATWQDSVATLGEQLLPIMTDVTNGLSGLATWVGENTGLVTGLAIGIGVLAGGILAISTAMKVYQAVQTVQTAVQWAQNAAWLSSPVTWIVLAVVALIAAIILLWLNWEQVWQWMLDAAAAVAAWWQETWDGIAEWWNGLLAGIGEWWNTLWGETVPAAIDMAVGWITDAWNGYWGWWGDALGAAGEWWNDLWAGAGDFIGGVVDGIASVWQGLVDWFFDAWASVGDFISDIFGGINDAIAGAADFVGGIFGLSADAHLDVASSTPLLPGGIPSHIQLASPLAAIDTQPTSALRNARPSTALEQHVTNIEVNVDGALDATAVARQIHDILKRGKTVGAF